VGERLPCKFSCGKTYARVDYRLAHEMICDGSPPVTSHAKGAAAGIGTSLALARSSLYLPEPVACAAGCGRFFKMPAYL
jgi:hypothetical protein